MPRIDPSRLLKCLTPLLDPNSGAIKSDKEVDKIYGLMSKFSKKLVSKCTYINILKASNAGVLDLFMQRGGWEMIHGWTVDATSNKNHALLKEITTLLIHTPASIQRLKENDLPRIIKTLSKECEDDVTRELAKKVVAKWISVAKQEDVTISDPNKNLHNLQPVQTSHPTSVLVNNPGMKLDMSNNPGNGNQNVNIATSSTMETESHHQEFDGTSFDIGNTDLNDYSLSDFNPDVFSKTIDQHLGVGDPQPDGNNSDMSTFQPSNQVTTTNIKVQAATPTPVIQTTPKITIRTVGGQTAVLNPVNTTGNDGTPYCLVTRDGKHFLMKLKLADQPAFIQQQPPQAVRLEDVTKQVKIEEPSIPVQTEENTSHIATNVPQTIPAPTTSSVVSSTTASTSPIAAPTTITPGEKKRRPRKDPTMTAKANSVVAGVRTYGNLKAPTSETSGGVVTNQIAKATLPGAKIEAEDPAKKPVVAKKKSSSASSKSAAAAAAAKQAEEEAKLREKIKKEKQMMKQRQKDAKKQQQEVKDQETLKKLNLSSTPPSQPAASTGMKIPKIPKKSISFMDAIGIPGASENGSSPDKIKATKKDKSEVPNTENKDLSPTDPEAVKKLEEESKKAKDPPPPKERRHRVKVYNSKSSRADDLLKDMTENLNAKSKAEAAKEKQGEPKSVIAAAGIKPLKRPSLEGVGKPGDSKKLKLSDEKLEKEKIDKKKEEKEKEKEKNKIIKEKPKSANTIMESSLFMDMLNASSEQKTTKKKRRLSSSGGLEKEKDPKSKDKAALLSPNKNEGVKPTLFNFYRETLGDDDAEETASADISMEVDEKTEGGDMSPSASGFTPTDEEGKLKSALCIHRSKSKPKKSVRFREEQELREFHYFEMDETERVNVTKVNKDFSTMKQHEKAEEKLFLRRKLVGDPMAEKTDWKELIPIWVSSDTPLPIVTSEEKDIQEARENTILGLFLPPGSILPESPTEPDLNDPANDKGEFKLIPSEDVAGVTKLCDHTNLSWPAPQGAGFLFPSNMNNAKQYEPEPSTMPLNKFSITQPLPPVQLPNVSFPNVQNPPMDFNNPWNNPFSVPVPTSMPPPGPTPDLWNVGPENFVPFPTPNMNMPPPGMPFGINPYGGFDGPPPAQDGFNNFNSQGPGQNFGGNNNPNPSHHGRDHNNFSNRSGSGHSSVRGRGGSGSSRDFERDRHGQDYNNRRDNRDNRDRNSHRDHRDRDHRNDFDRGRDRDHSRNKGRGDRDYRSNHDRDRSRGKGKREVPCRYYMKGYCHNGAKCDFSHSDPSHGNSQYLGGNKERSSGFSSMQPDDFSSRSSKGRQGSPSLFPDEEIASPSSNSNAISSNSISSATSYSQAQSVPSGGEEESTRFAVPPSSPTNDLYPPGTEPARVIPVYSLDD